MKVVALVSGGKDSCYNMIQCVAEGHDIVALANMRPVGKDELDSYMFQSVGHRAIELYAEAMNLPLFRQDIKGTAVVQGKDYQPSDGDEVEDLYQLLRRVQENIEVEAVSVGAILSNYQRVRVENVCTRLGLKCLGYLWRRNQEELLEEMIGAKIEAIIIKVAALGLNFKHLGKTLAEVRPHMNKMKEQYQLNPCGEGGEYETFTLDCPLFNKKIIIDEYEVVHHDSDPFAPVSYLSFKKIHLEDKDVDPSVSFKERICDLPIKRGSALLRELGNPHLKAVTMVTPYQEELTVPQLTSDIKDDEDGITATKVQVRKGPSGFYWISGIHAVRNSGSITQSITAAFQSLKGILEANNLHLESVVLVYLFCQDLAEYEVINSVMVTLFSQNPTSRVCVQANLDEDTVFLLDCLVYHPPVSDKEISQGLQRNTMHVQGISHWAPANIGPYSQCVQIGNCFYCAGVIGLCPSTMCTIEGGIHAENVLCLRSITRILQAMQESIQLHHILFAICFVTDSSFIQTSKEDFEQAVNNNKSKPDEGCIDTVPLVCCVVVPSLPRNVSVEWHVVASRTGKSKHCNGRKVNCGDVYIDWKSSWDEAARNGMVLFNVEMKNPVLTLSLSSLFVNLFKELKTSLYQFSCSMKSVLCLRLFYLHRLVDLQNISKAFSDCLRKECSDDDQPVIVCIPVEALQPGCVLSLCAYIQDLIQEENDP